MLALAGCTTVPNAPATQPALAGEVVTLPAVGNGEVVQAQVWSPPDPRAVALLAGDSSNRPEGYGALVERLVGMGLVVIAPDGAGLQTFLSAENRTRQGVARLGSAALYAKDRFAGLPVVAVGHGSGSLNAMALSGALTEVGEFTEPTPRGIIAFSAPAGTERLAGIDAVTTVGVPVLLVAGSEDRLPAERLLAAGGAEAEADSYALVLAGGGPDLVEDAALVDRAWPVIDLFVQAYLFDIFTAGDVLEDWQATGEDRFQARRGGQ